jgi:hypothetical protein
MICDWCEWEMYGCLALDEPPPETSRPTTTIGHWYYADASGKWVEKEAVFIETRAHEPPAWLQS